MSDERVAFFKSVLITYLILTPPLVLLFNYPFGIGQHEIITGYVWSDPEYNSFTGTTDIHCLSNIGSYFASSFTRLSLYGDYTHLEVGCQYKITCYQGMFDYSNRVMSIEKISP